MDADAVGLLAVQPIRHNGRSYAPGEVLAVPQADALALLAEGAATAHEPPKPVEPARDAQGTEVGQGIADAKKTRQKPLATAGNGGLA